MIIIFDIAQQGTSRHGFVHLIVALPERLERNANISLKRLLKEGGDPFYNYSLIYPKTLIILFIEAPTLP